MRFSRPPQWNGRRLAGLLGLVLGLSSCSGAGDSLPNGSGAPSESSAATAGATVPASSPSEEFVLPGVEILLSDSLHLVRDRRVGLITNQTGVDSGGRLGIDLLWAHPGVDLVALFSPEHGIRGDAPPGAAIAREVDERTGLPVHSLYGDTRRPTPGMLEGIDILLFDIQDVGARYYTYVSTMALAMEAAGDADIPFLVLDRPNPVGGSRVQGNVLDPEFATFVGLFPVPMRHGMTPGELALLFRRDFDVEVDLTVVPARGWRRSMSFEDTGLPWIAPSPNIPTPEAALHYAGTCLFEGTNLSVGRGTEYPFEQIGAPWLDGVELARRLSSLGLPGVEFEAVRFTPSGPGDGKYDGVQVSGVRFHRTGNAYDPPRVAVSVLEEARALAGENWEWLASHFDRLAGTDRLRLGIEAGEDPATLTEPWAAQIEAFLELREPLLLY